MLTGRVTTDLEATVSLTVLGPIDSRVSLDIVIDTGFNGYLTLPAPVIRQLALEPAGYTNAQLAAGTIVVLRKFEARVAWHRAERDVLVLETDGGPLLGMSLLHGSDLFMRVLSGGEVRIVPRPAHE